MIGAAEHKLYSWCDKDTPSTRSVIQVSGGSWCSIQIHLSVVVVGRALTPQSSVAVTHLHTGCCSFYLPQRDGIQSRDRLSRRLNRPPAHMSEHVNLKEVVAAFGNFISRKRRYLKKLCVIERTNNPCRYDAVFYASHLSRVRVKSQVSRRQSSGSKSVGASATFKSVSSL